MAKTENNNIVFASAWDSFTWILLSVLGACCFIPLFLDDGYWPVVVSVLCLAVIVMLLKSIRYEIDGDRLIIYQFFVPKSYPIDKIASIESTTSALSAPAASLSHRLAIKFTDRKIMGSFMPLIISPMRQKEFIAVILRVNPQIKIVIK